MATPKRPAKEPTAIVPVGGNFFSSVRKARAILKEQATQIYEACRVLAAQAAAAGDYETAEKVLWKLIEHMPDEEGERLVEISIDKPKDDGKSKFTGPAIQIGVQIGGINKPKELPTIDIITIEPSTNDDE